jgi:hypothetical protein
VTASVAAPRIEYLGFQNVAAEREFRFRIHGTEGWNEYRLRVAIAAFGTTRLQDGPDICYQKLLKVLAAGEAPGADPILIDDADLASYKEAHTKVAKHRAGWVPSTATVPPVAPPRNEPRPRPPTPAENVPLPRFQEGQRVSHATFGEGVTISSGGGHTLIQFDEHGPKRFVTSMLKADVISAAGTWESGPRGVNRPVKVARDPAPR